MNNVNKKLFFTFTSKIDGVDDDDNDDNDDDDIVDKDEIKFTIKKNGNGEFFPIRKFVFICEKDTVIQLHLHKYYK